MDKNLLRYFTLVTCASKSFEGLKNRNQVNILIISMRASVFQGIFMFQASKRMRGALLRMLSRFITIFRPVGWQVVIKVPKSFFVHAYFSWKTSCGEIFYILRMIFNSTLIGH